MRRRRKNNKIVEEGIITLRRENNKIEGKYENCGGGNSRMRSENNKIVEEGIKKIEDGNVVKEDSSLSLTILIDFFQIAVYLSLFVFIVSNY